MLKIKDNVDLKELEKFGFEAELLNIPENKIVAYKKDCKVMDCDKDKDSYFIEIANDKHREIVIKGKLYKIYYCDIYYIYDFVLTELNILFDLIQAGLVEKVKEKENDKRI